MTKIKIPHGRDLAYATLQAVERRGGSVRTSELTDTDAVSEITGLTEKEMKQLSLKSVKMQMGWARTGLKSSGHLDNSQLGVWSLTLEGLLLSRSEPPAAQKAARQAYERGWAQIRREKALHKAAESSVDAVEDWKGGLLEAIQKMDPAPFARLCERLLKEAGFRDLETADGNGEDGFVRVGVYKHHLISSRVYIQCQRRTDRIPAREIRAFRTAMSGRANHGLFITTSAFTRDAQRKAKAGAQPIDLIDGEELCRLLKDHGLGVTVETRERVTINQKFFDTV